ncbi:hypothetical protein GM182_01640 [bacterium 3DAC]|nr:hypothetical protein GM182_01640 [bacterium 3DAC]
MPRGFRNLVRMKPNWHVLIFPFDVDNVREIYGLLGGKGSITCLVVPDDVDEYKRQLSYLPYGGPSTFVLPRGALKSLDGYFHTAIFLIPIDKFSRPEEVLFDIYRLLHWHGYVQVIHFIAGGKEDIWTQSPDSYSIKVAALLKKTGFMLSDARALEIADGIWVKVEGVKRDSLSDEDIAY